MNDNLPNEPNPENRQDLLLHDEEAFRLRQEENHLETAKRSTTYFWIINSIYGLLGMLQILLGLRFFLRLFGANPQNEFARLINNLSAPFFAPFSNLFILSASDSGANVFDFNILIAIVAYALFGYIVVAVVRFVFYQRII